jgi:hypothetical protein
MTAVVTDQRCIVLFCVWQSIFTPLFLYSDGDMTLIHGLMLHDVAKSVSA